MQNSNKSEKQIFDLINKNHHQYKGTFNASVDGREFMVANTNLLFHTADKDYFIVGADDYNHNVVAFCVPQDLIKDGPHQVRWYEGELVWSVRISNVSHVIKQGLANVTFSRTGENRSGVSGDIDFVLPDGKTVTGKFDIKRL